MDSRVDCLTDFFLLVLSREEGNTLSRGYIGIIFPYSPRTANKLSNYPNYLLDAQELSSSP